MKKLSASSPALRRIKSSQELMTLSCRDDKPSPRSILDFAFSGPNDESFCAYDEPGRPRNCASNEANPSRASCLGALDLLTSETGLLGQNLYWCCAAGNRGSSIKGTSIKQTTLVPVDSSQSEKGCGGYFDYIGTYHPCTAATDKDHVACQVSIGFIAIYCDMAFAFSHSSCRKGCTFRRGMHGYEAEQPELAELYYDR